MLSVIPLAARGPTQIFIFDIHSLHTREVLFQWPGHTKVCLCVSRGGWYSPSFSSVLSSLFPSLPPPPPPLSPLNTQTHPQAPLCHSSVDTWATFSSWQWQSLNSLSRWGGTQTLPLRPSAVALHHLHQGAGGRREGCEHQGWWDEGEGGEEKGEGIGGRRLIDNGTDCLNSSWMGMCVQLVTTEQSLDVHLWKFHYVYTSQHVCTHYQVSRRADMW